MPMVLHFHSHLAIMLHPTCTFQSIVAHIQPSSLLPIQLRLLSGALSVVFFGFPVPLRI